MQSDFTHPHLRVLALVFLVFGTLSLGAAAQDAHQRLQQADAAQGDALIDKHNCNGACHLNKMNEELSDSAVEIYTRASRRVSSVETLLAQVEYCSSQLRLSWFPEDDAATALSLNQRYYRFP